MEIGTEISEACPVKLLFISVKAVATSERE
jgi:hypothetical protein